jgi:hypothetical protein
VTSLPLQKYAAFVSEIINVGATGICKIAKNALGKYKLRTESKLEYAFPFMFTAIKQ